MPGYPSASLADRPSRFGSAPVSQTFSRSLSEHQPFSLRPVVAGPDPATQTFFGRQMQALEAKTWIAGSSPAMTGEWPPARTKLQTSPPPPRRNSPPSPLPPGEVEPKVRVRAFRVTQRRRIHSSWTMPEPYRTTVTLSRILFLVTCGRWTLTPRPSRYLSEMSLPGSTRQSRLPSPPAISAQGKALDCRGEPRNDRRGRPFAMAKLNVDPSCDGRSTPHRRRRGGPHLYGQLRRGAVRLAAGNAPAVARPMRFRRPTARVPARPRMTPDLSSATS